MKEKNTYNEHIGTKLPDDLRVNPFSVPEGYFQDLEKSIRVQITEQKLKDSTANIDFIVPKGYFESLTQQLESKIFEQKLKDDIVETGFAVPESYFESSQTNIVTTIAEMELQEKVSDDGYSIPTGYFDDLANRSMSIARMEQLASPQKNNFTVPDSYFETLSSNIIHRIATEKVTADDKTETPVVKMPSRRTWSQYAAAAVVALMISVASYWALDSSKQTQADADIPLALHEISNEEIFNYLTQVTDGVELIELASFLQEGNAEKPFEVNGQVKDQEIEEYLNYML